MSSKKNKNIKKQPKNSRVIPKRQSAFMVAAKAVMLCLTAVYSLFMVSMTGAGIIYNRSSYGSEITHIGVMFIVSAALMTAGAVLCIFRKTLPNLLSFLFTASGFSVCMVMLRRFVRHAEDKGWSGYGKYQFVPVSDMFKGRILPVIAPAAIALVIAAVQFFSYEASEERRERKRRRTEKENAPAPSILDGE